MKTIPQGSIRRFLMAASLALAVPLSALAFGGHGGMGGMGGDRLPPQLKALDLSEAQRDKVFEIMHAQAPQMRERAKALHKAEGELRSLTASADYSDAKARMLADAAARAMAEMTLARVKTERQVYELLTPEQRKQYAEAKPHERRHGMGPGRGGPAPQR